MGHVLLIFGTLVAVNLGIGYMVSDYLYDEKDPAHGVVEVEEVAPAPHTTITPVKPREQGAEQ